MNKNLDEFLSDFMKNFLTESKNALYSLDSILKSHKINYIIIGGMAIIKYKYSRTTDDIDILVDKKDKIKIENLPIGFIKKVSNKKFLLHEPKHIVEIIYSDEISGDGINGLVFPSPSKISEIIDGLPYISLDKLVEFKLSSGIYGKRHQDIADVQELIRKNKLNKKYGDNFRKDLKKKYLEIWQDAQEEFRD